MAGEYAALFEDEDIITFEGMHPDLVGLITRSGQIPPLLPLPDDSVLVSLNDPAFAHLNNLIAEAARNYRMVRQQADFELAMGQLMVLHRHWLQRHTDSQGVLH